MDGSIVKKSIKNGALLFVVGILVALAAPAMASLLGPGIMGAGMVPAQAAPAAAMWTGLVFGAFGAIHPMLEPVADYIFGDDKAKSQPHAAKEHIIRKSAGMAAPVKQAEVDDAKWLKFKRDVYADGSLSIGYLTDKKGLGFSESELLQLGVKPAAYNRDQPPAALVAATQQKLGQDVTGTLSEPTKDAIIADKTKEQGWIDGRKNNGAVEMLEAALAGRYAQIVDTSRVAQASLQK